MTQPAGADAAAAEVVTLASELIAIDTTNTGDRSATGTERKAADYVAEKLSEAGYDVTYVESGAPGCGNVIKRDNVVPARDLIFAFLAAAPPPPRRLSHVCSAISSLVVSQGSGCRERNCADVLRRKAKAGQVEGVR